MAAAIQFIEEAYGTYFIGIIYGTYGQTTGPMLKEYVIMNKIMNAAAA
jgi:hypothetical protein